MKRIQKIFLLAIIILLFNIFAYAQSDDMIVSELSKRHPQATIADLERIAGGKEKLITRLLELRTKESPPFVGVRAEKILLGYSSVPEVKSALEADVQSKSHKGLARIIAANIDRVSDTDTRRFLARQIVERGQTENEFRALSKSFSMSKDAEVARLVK